MKKFTIKTLQEFKQERGMKTTDFWRVSHTPKKQAKFTPLFYVHVQLVHDDQVMDANIDKATDKACHELFSFLTRNQFRHVVYARGNREIVFLMREQSEAAMFKLAMA